jgi:hypothetical protein
MEREDSNPRISDKLINGLASTTLSTRSSFLKVGYFLDLYLIILLNGVH